MRPGQRIDIRLQGNAARSGQVVRLSPAIDAAARSLLVEGEMPNEDGLLRPGSFVEGLITVDAGAHGISIPATALISFAGVERAFVAAAGTLDERILRTGRRLPGRSGGIPPTADLTRSRVQPTVRA